MSDSSRSAAAAGAFSRRALLAATLAATASVAVGCTGTDGGAADAITQLQIDQLAEQVDVQARLVAAFDRAFAASPELAAAAATLADQARAQLERLEAAAPDRSGTAPSTAAPSAAAPSAAAPPATAPPATAPSSAGVRAQLRAEVTRAADAHTAACPGFSGARAALLGSIAAGLRGQAGQLA